MKIGLVIFSDETKIMLGNNNKIHVWMNPGERLRPECLDEFGDKERTCRVSVMFWGCISYHGVGALTPVDGNINTEKYISILGDNLWTIRSVIRARGQITKYKKKR